jgi:hypothetical protein
VISITTSVSEFIDGALSSAARNDALIASSQEHHQMMLIILAFIVLMMLGGSRAIGTFAIWFSIPWIVVIVVGMMAS